MHSLKPASFHFLMAQMLRLKNGGWQAPKAAAYVAMTSGVSASPTRPRIPDTLTIRPPCAMNFLRGMGVR